MGKILQGYVTSINTKILLIMNKTKEFFQDPLKAFLAKAFGLYLLWNILYYGWAENGIVDIWLSANVAQLATLLLNLIGYNATYSFSTMGAGVALDGNDALGIGHPCNGLVLYVLFTGFIVAYAGNWKLKAVIIPIGVALLYFINIIRCALLVINYNYHNQYFELNHKFTYTIIVYGIVFVFWMIWANRLSKITLGKHAIPAN
jgi:exosortase family protein XrtF